MLGLGVWVWSLGALQRVYSGYIRRYRAEEQPQGLGFWVYGSGFRVRLGSAFRA